jgi:hypothetical protein
MSFRNREGNWRTSYSFKTINGTCIGLINVLLAMPDMKADLYEYFVIALREPSRDELLIAVRERVRRPAEMFSMVAGKRVRGGARSDEGGAPRRDGSPVHRSIPRGACNPPGEPLRESAGAYRVPVSTTRAP